MKKNVPHLTVDRAHTTDPYIIKCKVIGNGSYSRYYLYNAVNINLNEPGLTRCSVIDPWRSEPPILRRADTLCISSGIIRCYKLWGWL